jgi:hypothetical protein
MPATFAGCCREKAQEKIWKLPSIQQARHPGVQLEDTMLNERYFYPAFKREHQCLVDQIPGFNSK